MQKEETMAQRALREVQELAEAARRLGTAICETRLDLDRMSGDTDRYWMAVSDLRDADETLAKVQSYLRSAEWSVMAAEGKRWVW